METQVRGYFVTSEQGTVWEMGLGRPATFKLLSEQTGGSIAVFEEMVPVGDGTPLHIHPTSDEVIHIVAGEFTIKIGEEVTKVSADAYVFIPRGTAHAWRNTGSEVGEATYTFTPADGAKFFEALSLLKLPMKAVDPETMAVYRQEYGFVFVSDDW